MIKLNKIRKLIGTFYLRDITLEIPEGYIIGLVGANGCGKTSLLHIVWQREVGFILSNSEKGQQKNALFGAFRCMRSQKIYASSSIRGALLYASITALSMY